MNINFKVLIRTILFFTVLFLIACEKKKSLQESEGFINVKGGKVWYRIAGSGDKTPLLLLHGGPGVPSYYLKPLAALSVDRPVIFFDQLGCGNSDRISDTSLMTIDNYIEEVEQVKNALGLKEYFLYGHSWGSMLGMDFYLKHPDGIKALIFSGPALSIPRWSKDADTLISTLPDSLQNAIRMNEARKTYDDSSYQRALKYYYQQFLARKLPWSPDVDSAFMMMGQNVYLYMEGPSEFTLTGTFKNYDRTDRLHEIKVPTLFITGEYDEARPISARYYQSLVPGARFELIENAGHLTMHDNPNKNLLVIKNFLNPLDK